MEMDFPQSDREMTSGFDKFNLERAPLHSFLSNVPQQRHRSDDNELQREQGNYIAASKVHTHHVSPPFGPSAQDSSSILHAHIQDAYRNGFSSHGMSPLNKDENVSFDEGGNGMQTRNQKNRFQPTALQDSIFAKRERYFYSYLLQIQKLVNSTISGDISTVVKRTLQASSECDPETAKYEMERRNEVLQDVLSAALVTKTIAYYRGPRLVDRNVAAAFLLSMCSYSMEQAKNIFIEEKSKLEKLLKQFQEFNSTAKHVLEKRQEYESHLREHLESIKQKYKEQQSEETEMQSEVRLFQESRQQELDRAQRRRQERCKDIANRSQKEIEENRRNYQEKVFQIRNSLLARIREAELQAETRAKDRLEKEYHGALSRVDSAAESVRDLENRLTELEGRIRGMQELKWYKYSVRRLMQELHLNSYERAIWFSCAVSAADYRPHYHTVLEHLNQYMNSSPRRSGRVQHRSARKDFLALRNLRSALLSRSFVTKVE